MMTHALDVHSIQHLVDAIVAARDSARGQLQLLSTDALDQWQELESQLDCLQSRIEYERSNIKPGAVARVREAIDSVAKFLCEAERMRSKGSPASMRSSASRALSTHTTS